MRRAIQRQMAMPTMGTVGWVSRPHLRTPSLAAPLRMRHQASAADTVAEPMTPPTPRRVPDGARPMAARTRVRLLIERGQLQAAAELISAMPAAAEGMRCDREELETRLLHRCLKAKAAGDLGLAILESLAARGALDLKACREALHVCGTSGSWREARALLRYLEQLGERRASDFGDAIRACAAGGQLEQMWQLAHEAEQMAAPADKGTQRAMMQACRHAKDVAGAEALWQRMCGRDAMLEGSPDPDALSAYLMLCADQRQWQRAHALLAEADRAGLPPSLKHWNVTLSACVRAGAMDDAERLLDAMPHTPNVVSFNTLLHGYAQLWVTPSGDGDRKAAAEVLRERMRAAGVRPTEVTYNALLDLHRFDVQEVLRLLDEMGANSIQPCRITYSKLARALWNAEEPRLARGVVPQMEVAGLVPDAPFYRAQIAAAESMGMHAHAEELYHEACARGLEVSYSRSRGRGGGPSGPREVPDHEY